MSCESFYWYDYETFGTDPARDRPVQFGGLRTDIELNPISEPKVLFCKPSPDYLPHPDACLITGITPQIALQRGLRESDFIAAINAEFSVPRTCVVGYNNIRFDDEVTRYTLYRNLMDPYSREWRYGNSRWDLIDVMRMMRALRPEGMNWPKDDAGTPTLKLDKLTKANGIEHEDAHDALSDVHATIAMARLAREKQPRLFSYLMANRAKQQASNLLSLGTMQPLIHASSRFSVDKGGVAVVVALTRHPVNSNGVVTYDLSIDPSPLIDLDQEELYHRLFTPREALPPGVDRLPLKTVHINKCPALAPMSVMREADAERLGLDLALCRKHLDQLRAVPRLDEKVRSILEIDHRTPLQQDPDLMLYSGFFGDTDRNTLEQLHGLSAETMALSQPVFEDARLPELWFRFRARNYPETLNASEMKCWKQFCQDRLSGKGLGGSLTLEEFNARLAELDRANVTAADGGIISDLKSYVKMLWH